MKKRSFAFRRLAVMSAFLAAVLAGAAEYSGLGSFCSMGASAIALACPLGALEAMLAAREVFPWLAAGFLLVAAAVVLVGLLSIRTAAASAADLGALAGAGAALESESVACARAARVVDANGARLRSCEVTGAEVRNG